MFLIFVFFFLPTDFKPIQRPKYPKKRKMEYYVVNNTPTVGATCCISHIHYLTHRFIQHFKEHILKSNYLFKQCLGSYLTPPRHCKTDIYSDLCFLLNELLPHFQHSSHCVKLYSEPHQHRENH